MKSKNVVPSIFTACSLACGLFVIFSMSALGANELTYAHLFQASIIVLFSALLDVLDGAIARVIHAESSFGGVFDSMADGIAFGIAPAVVLVKALAVVPGKLFLLVASMSAMVYAISGILRLVRFTVTNFEAEEDEASKAMHKSSFTGLPIPAAAACLLSLILLLFFEDFLGYVPLSMRARGLILIAAACFLGYVMISNWKFPSIKKLSFAVSSFLVLLITVVFVVFLVGGLFNSFPYVFALVSWGYCLGSFVRSLFCVARD